MAIYKDKTPTKDGRCWYFKVYKKDFEGNNKAYKSKRYSTKKEAQEEEALFLLKRDNPTHKSFKLVANDFFKNLYKENKESTVSTYVTAYNKHIAQFFEKYNIDEINIKEIKNWKETLETKGYKASYLNKLYNVLKSIFDFAIVNYGLSINPVEKLGRFKEKKDKVIETEQKIRYITYDDFQTFISAIDNNMWKTFFMFLYYTGMRKGEALALTWKDIDLDNNVIKVNKTLYSKIKGKYTITSTKNNLNREIKLSKTIKDQLIDYKNEVKKYTDFKNSWFVFGNTRFLPPTTIDRHKNYYFELSGVNPITIHEFRHSHVSLLINEYIKTSKEKNVKIDTAKFFLMMSNRMGHSVEVMQRIYLHLFPTAQDEIVDILDNL